MAKKLNLVKLPTKVSRVPTELIEALEQVVVDAKEGRLCQIVMSFHSDPPEGHPPVDYQVGGDLMWDRQGRVDAIHSKAVLLSLHAAEQCMGTEEDLDG